MITEGRQRELAARLASVPGVVGATLGGSRVRGTAVSSSDVDLGVYYRGELDVEALGVIARDVGGPDATVSRPGDWGPWVDGGAWLRVDGVAVDWIYRDLDRVASVWTDAQEGRFAFHFQVGHPLGFADFAYAGELAMGVVLADDTGELTARQAPMRVYPPELRRAVPPRVLWEAGFLVEGAAKSLERRDTLFVAGCLFRTIGLLTHAVHASAGRWLITEKGAVDATEALAGAPADFADRAYGVLAGLSRNRMSLAAALDAARRLVADTTRACAVPDR